MEGEKKKKRLSSSKIKRTTHSAHPARSQEGSEQTSVRTAASAKGKGSRGRPCPSPAVPHTTHAHARAPSSPRLREGIATAKRQRSTRNGYHASQAATGERDLQPALLDRAPPLVASRDVTTPTSTPPGRNPAPQHGAAALAPPGLSAQAPPPGRPIGSRPHPPLPGAPRLPGS